MASLKYILDAEDDQSERPDPRGSRAIQKDAIPTPPPGSHVPGSSTSAPQSHVSSNTLARPIESISSSAPSASSGKRHSTSSSRAQKAGAAPSSSSTPPFPARRQSTASNDSMDHASYGSAASSASMGGGGRHAFRPPPPNRPLTGSPGQDVKLTPITRRVSRAKKGQPVHVCDLCRPPKTFTRAEHLRRHQLSHRNPEFACPVPGCDKTFHRPDLLARHQQRHEQDGIEQSVSGSGGQDTSRRTSQTSSLSLEERIPRLGLQPPVASPSITGRMGNASTPSTASTEMPSTPSLTGGSSSFHGLASPASHGAVPMSPSTMDGGSTRDGYGSSSRPPHSYSYAMSPSLTVLQHPNIQTASQMTDQAMQGIQYHSTRPATTMPLYLVTQGLPMASQTVADSSGPPDLCHPHDASPWASSTSDSTYSTPSDIPRSLRQSRYSRTGTHSPSAEWQPPQMLPQAGGGAFDSMGPPYFVNMPPSPSMTAPHHGGYGPILELPMSQYSTDSSTAMMDPMATTHAHMPSHHRMHHHRHSSSLSSVRSSTPPLAPNPTQPAEPLVTPSATLPDRISALVSLGRQKGMVMGAYQGLDIAAGSGMLGSLAYGANAGSPGGNGNGFLAVPDLTGAGPCAMPGVMTGIPLPRATRNAIPGYINVYWERFHSLCPVVHRPSLEEAGEDVLRFAMAAIGTQYLESKEDRVRGGQLHETAWQEVKRYPQWNLQVMQAILLLEYFARFRGRKAVTRPSSVFQSLYSRIRFPSAASYDSTVPHDYAFNGFPVQQHGQSQDQLQSNEERWRQWLDVESRRRLLQSCFLADVHTFIYHEQRRSTESDFPPNAVPVVPLIGRSAALWEATTADDWAARIAADPDASVPQFLPHLDTLNTLRPEDLESRPNLDCSVILAFLASRLGRQATPSVISQDDATPKAGSFSNQASAAAHRRASHQMDFSMDLVPEQPLPLAQNQQYHIAPAPSIPRSHRRSQSQPLLVPTTSLTTPRRHRRRPSSHDKLAEAAAARASEAAEDRLASLFAMAPVAHVYLALQHTPLHDLLAVSGDSWVFSQKVLQPTSFLEHQKRLKAWAEGDLQGGSGGRHRGGNRAGSLSPTVGTAGPTIIEEWPSGIGGSGSDGGELASLSAARAAVYASRALVLFLERERERERAAATAPQAAAVSTSYWMEDISDYWALYVCALIIWAFGHRAAGAAGGRGERGSSAMSSSSSSSSAAAAASSASVGLGIGGVGVGGFGGVLPTSVSSSGTGTSTGAVAAAAATAANMAEQNAAAAADEEAERWLRALQTMQPAEAVRARGRRPAGLVVGMVRRRLDRECVGGRSRLFVDAVGVLKKLEEGINWKWF